MKLARQRRRSDSRTYAGRTLDVSLREDSRNDEFRMQERFGAGTKIPIHSKTWDCGYTLDQGSEGACVGFATAHFYGSESRPQKVSNRRARKFYKGAQKHDQWPGENYSGTSVNGMMRWLRAQGYVGKYNWIRLHEELARTISHHGPVIVGSEWPEECFYPDRQGFIEFDGIVRGGHATCWRGINVEEEYFLIQQSWGRQHGINGTVKMRFEDAAKLLNSGPQIVFPEKRALEPLQSSLFRRFFSFFD